MIYRISHVTRVRYARPVRFARFNIRLQPVPWPGQTVSDIRLTVDPLPLSLVSQPGACPVQIARVVMAGPLSELTVRSSFTAQVEDGMLGMMPASPSIATLSRLALDMRSLDAWAPAHYLFPSPLLPPMPEIAAWAGAFLPADASAFDSALALCRHIHETFVYDGDATEADTPVQEAFAIRRGVCQDFAHILISALRSAGLPAAYVSGYLRTTPPPGKARLIGADAMHAWVGLWCGPQLGWMGLDPTNGCATGAGHVAVALGRDYADVSPIDGSLIGGGAQRLTTSVDMVPVDAPNAV